MAAFISAKVAEMPLLAGKVGNEASGLPFLDSLADYHEFVNDTPRSMPRKRYVCILQPLTDAEICASASEFLTVQCFVWPP